MRHKTLQSLLRVKPAYQIMGFAEKRKYHHTLFHYTQYFVKMEDRIFPTVQELA